MAAATNRGSPLVQHGVSDKRSFWKTLPGLLTAVATLIGAVSGLLVAIQVWWHPASPGKVSGFVYNGDVQPAVGLPDIKLAYIPFNPTNSPPVHITTTSPTGNFSFDCAIIKKKAFPIHLQMTYSWSGKTQVIQSDDPIYLAGANDMNLYLSPLQITNSHRIVAAIMRVNTAQLLRQNFTTLTATGASARLPTSGIVVVPKNLRFPTELVR